MFKQKSSTKLIIGYRCVLAICLITACTLSSVSAQSNCEYPRSLIVLDRSASMNRTIGDQTKWDIASGAIEGMLNTFGQNAYFGLMLYPGPSGLGANGVEGAVGACRRNLADDTCTTERPMCSTGEVVVGVGPNTSQAIQAELAWPEGLSNAYTPTWQTLEKASTYMPLVQGAHDKYVILITDGWQCCGYYEQNGNSYCESASSERRIPVDKVRALRDQGVTVFVVGFGGSVDVTTLQDMAVEAGTQRPGCDPETTDVTSNSLCYYQAGDSMTLNSLLTDIARQISEEVCDGQDNDCDGQIDEALVQNCQNDCGNGQSVCAAGQWSECMLPMPAEETCNGLDDDCDGQIDENLSRRCESACGSGTETCVFGTWGACSAPTVEAEICNALDDNCDGRIDEGCDCLDGERQECGQNIGRCTTGVQICSQNTWGECQGQVQPQEEDCNGIDDDCDGTVDEVVTQDCSTACGSGSISCMDGEWTTCDAPPVGTESCNGIDDDCDGIQDEGDFCQGEGGICICGGCAQPCTNGECFGESVCQGGYCVIDQCPEGSYCLEDSCVEGESPFQDMPMSMDSDQAGTMVVPVEQRSSPGSSCRSTSQQGNGLSLLLLSLLSLLLLRREKSLN